jgi:hypothetical protein
MNNMDYHTILGGIALAIGVYGYYPYIRDTLKGKTTPHPYTYGVQALVGTISVFAQLSKGAGPGAWAMIVPVLAGVVVFLLSLKKGVRPTKRDKYFLAAALAAIVVWRLTNDPLWAVWIVIIINTIGMYFTFKKGYREPHSETVSSYELGVVRSLVSLPALTAYNWVTLLPILHHILVNAALVVMLRVRRRTAK